MIVFYLVGVNLISANISHVFTVATKIIQALMEQLTQMTEMYIVPLTYSGILSWTGHGFEIFITEMLKNYTEN